MAQPFYQFGIDVGIVFPLETAIKRANIPHRSLIADCTTWTFE